MTVTDPLDNDVKAIDEVLKNRELYTIFLPQKMKSLAGTRKKLIISLGLIGLACGVGYFIEH